MESKEIHIYYTGNLVKNGGELLKDSLQINILDLGQIAYEKSYAIQEDIHKRRLSGELPDVVIFQECDPVITIGKSGSEKHLLLSQEVLAQKGISLVYSSRGGDITYHGPGQLIISPILYLRKYTRSVVGYLRILEQIVINMLAKYDVVGVRIDGASGVWVDNKKIAAIGIAIKNGVTQHGVAINIKPDLAHYNFIIPCGLKNTGVTSLDDLGVSYTDRQKVKDDFLKEFSVFFNTEIEEKTLNGEVYKNGL